MGRLGNMFCVCHAHQLDENKLTDESFTFYVIFHFSTTKLMLLFNIIKSHEGVNVPGATCFPVRFCGLYLLLHTLDLKVQPKKTGALLFQISTLKVM